MPEQQPAGRSNPELALIDAVLDEHGRRLTLRTATRGLLAVLAGAAAALLLAVVADHAWPGGLPPLVLRIALGLWGSLLLGFGLGVLIWASRYGLNPLFVARELERALGICHNSLVNHLLLRRTPDAAYAHAGSLHQAAREVQTHDSVPESRPVRWPGILVAAVVLIWLAYAWLASKPVAPSVARFFGADQPAPTATRLELIHPTENDVIHAGEPVTLEFAVHGRRVHEARLEILAGPGGRVEKAYPADVHPSMDGGSPRCHFALAPVEVIADICFRCVAGDARFEQRLPVYPVPVTEALDVTLQPPAYTGLLPRPAETPDFEALPGTLGAFRVRANVVIGDAVLVVSGSRQTRTRMRRDLDDARVAIGELIIAQGGEYWIELSDVWGYPEPDPARHQIVVQGDEPPTVAIVVPAPEQTPDGMVDVEIFPELVVEARDDVGVALGELVVERGTGVQRVNLPFTGQKLERTRVAARELVLPGETARAWVEARDARTTPDGRPAYQVARTRTVTLIHPGAAQRTSEEEQGRGSGRAPDEADAGDTSADEAESEPGGATPDESAGPEAAAGGAPTSAPASDPSAADESGTPAGTEEARPSDAPAEDSESSDAAEGEMGRFVREHGDETEEVVRELEGDSGGAPGTAGEEPTPSDEPPPDRTSGGTTGGEAPSGAPAGGASEGDSSAPPSEPQEGGEGVPSGGTGGGTQGPGGSKGVPPPAPVEPTSDEPLPALGEATTRRLLELIDRGAAVSEEMLVDMGWPLAKARAFVRDLERLRGLRGEQKVTDRMRQEAQATALGSEALARGTGLSAQAQRDADAGTVGRSEIDRLAPPADQQVPERLRAILEAYYRALARHRTAPAAPASQRATEAE